MILEDFGLECDIENGKLLSKTSKQHLWYCINGHSNARN
jgi:hypothetical protein